MTDKKIKVEFAPGCFDHFDGTQEELDDVVKQIQEQLAGMTAEDMESFGRPMTDEDFDELPEEVKEHIMKTLSDLDGDKPTKRNLQ